MDVKFHLEIVGFQPTLYDIGNTCTEDNAGNDVTVDVEVIRESLLLSFLIHFISQGKRSHRV